MIVVASHRGRDAGSEGHSDMALACVTIRGAVTRCMQPREARRQGACSHERCSDMARAAGYGAATWCVWLQEARRHGMCGHERGQQHSTHSWVGCSDTACATMRWGGDVAYVAARGAATWCTQLGGAQQRGTCGCGRCSDMVHVAMRGGGNVVCAARWGSATMWPM
jgi:hypothetical protein